MKAKALIHLPTGVVLGPGVTSYFERGDAAKGTAKVEIVAVRDVTPTQVEVTIEIDVELLATFMGDRGRGNPSLCIGYEGVDPRPARTA